MSRTPTYVCSRSCFHSCIRWMLPGNGRVFVLQGVAVVMGGHTPHIPSYSRVGSWRHYTTYSYSYIRVAELVPIHRLVPLQHYFRKFIIPPGTTPTHPPPRPPNPHRLQAGQVYTKISYQVYTKIFWNSQIGVHSQCLQYTFDCKPLALLHSIRLASTVSPAEVAKA